VALSQARILYQNHSGDYPQVILTIPVTCRTVLFGTIRMQIRKKWLNQLKNIFKNSVWNLCAGEFH
jgi:hypothetical protein